MSTRASGLEQRWVVEGSAGTSKTTAGGNMKPRVLHGELTELRSLR